MIYLDNSATTFPKPECVYAAVDYANRHLAFNSGRGVYKESINASNIIEDARLEVASLVNEESKKVVFFSSATEALNTIINGLDLKEGDCVYITPFEHNSIIRPLYSIKKEKKIEITILPFDRETWNPKLDKIDEMFSIKRPKAVFVSQVSNVTGFAIDYKNIFKLSGQYGCINVLDSSQSFGVLNPELANCDFCVFAGHKSLYATFGVAGFVNTTNCELKITKSGGNGSDSLNLEMQKKGPQRYEAGSQNVVAIYGLLKSINWLKHNKELIIKEKELTLYLINELTKLDKVKIYIPNSVDNIFGIVSLNIEGYISDDVSTILYDEFEIMTRSGYHCSPFVHDFINTLEFKGAVRISMGLFNDKEDIDKLIEALKTL